MHYDQNLDLVVACDASSYGVGAILIACIFTNVRVHPTLIAVADPEGFHRFPLKPPLLDNVYNTNPYLQQHHACYTALWILRKPLCLVPSFFTNCM